jgi:hypothetical protein
MVHDKWAEMNDRIFEIIDEYKPHLSPSQVGFILISNGAFILEATRKCHIDKQNDLIQSAIDAGYSFASKDKGCECIDTEDPPC